MALSGSIKAQKLAEDLLGLDVQTIAPEQSMYRGKYVEAVSGFYRKNKRPIMYVGGIAIVAGIAYAGYKMYLKKKEAEPAKA